MTTAAVVAEATEVRIVTPMTGIAVSRKRRVPPAVRHMTAITGHGDVGAGQRECCLDVVIEAPGAPIGRVMAGITLFAEPTAMRIIIAVAIDTVILGITIRRRGMAAVATDVRMRSQEWETRNVVVEAQLVGPASGDMAVFADLAELPFVHVVIEMAGTTFPRHRIVHITRVT